MKLKISLIFFICLISSQDLFSHKEWVHQYIVKEAYKLLELEVGEIEVLKNHMGMNFTGNVSAKDNPWYRDESVVIGAWREDEYDPIWGYGGGYGIGTGFSASMTHFWDADFGDNNKLDFAGNSYENSLEKAKLYMFGLQENANYKFGIEGKEILTTSNYSAHSAQKMFTYDGLANFYKTGKSKFVSFYDLSGRLRNVNENMVVYETVRKKWSFHLLGRIAHLLADMSVPAHTHSDTHPCSAFLGLIQDGDKYELEMGSNYPGDCNEEHSVFTAQDWDANTARQQGGLLNEIFSMEDKDALRYLFYTLNQYTDFYPSWSIVTSYHADGDNLLPNGSNPFLVEKFNELGTPPYHSESTEIANETFNYAIRATATLFYWFCIKAGIVSSCPDDLYYQNSKLYGTSIVNYNSNFQALQNIFIGKDVNSNIPNGNFVISSSADCNFIAGNEIHIKDGSYLQEGSNVKLSINSTNCLFSNEDNFSPSSFQGNYLLQTKPDRSYKIFDTTFIDLCSNSIIIGNSLSDTISLSSFGSLYIIDSSYYENDSVYIEKVSPDTLYFNDVIVRNNSGDSTFLELVSDTSHHYQIIYGNESFGDTTIMIYKKLNPSFKLSKSDEYTEMSNTEIIIYPMPLFDKSNLIYFLKEITTVSIILTDNLGNVHNRIVDNKTLEKGEHIIEIDGTNLSAGSYNIMIVFNGIVIETKKIMKIH